MEKERGITITEKTQMGYDTVLAPVLTKWDCDDCKHYPCVLQERSSDKKRKLRLNECGDHSERGTP